MGKLILIAALILIALLGGYFFIAKSGTGCTSYTEAECKTKLFCKSVSEYGVSCGEGGCQTGERFKNCSPRF